MHFIILNLNFSIDKILLYTRFLFNIVNINQNEQDPNKSYGEFNKINIYYYI